MEQAKKHCHRNGKLEFLIKRLGYSNCQNTWEPEDDLYPVIVQGYFQQPPLKKPTPTNAVSMTKILTKEPSVSWRCYIPLPLVLLSFFMLWSSLPKALFASVPTLNLGPLYDCRPPMTSWHIWIPLTEELLPRYVTARSHHIDILRKVLWYSPIATTLPIYYCTLETITMTCHYEHIFLVKSWYRNVKSVLLTDRFCLHAGLNQTAPIKRHNKTLTKVTDNNLKIPISISPTYDYGFSMAIVNTYHNFHVRTYKAQLIEAANVIEQHLTLSNTPYPAELDSTLNMGSWIPHENPNHIIVWTDLTRNATKGIHSEYTK